MSQKQVKTRRTSMDQGSIQELLNTEEFVSSLKENLGLKEDIYMACGNCGDELDVEKESGERIYVCNNDNCIEFAEPENVKRRRWIEKQNGLMNEQGVNMMIATIKGAVDRNQITSNFESEEIVSVMQTLHENLAYELYQNWTEYGVRNSSQAKKIMDICTNAVWSVFKRSLDAKTLDAISDMGNDQTVVKKDQGDNSGGLLGGRLSLGGQR